MSEVKQEGEFKIKKRKTPKKLVKKNEVAKVDLSKPKEEEVTKVVIDEQPKEEKDAVQEQSADAGNDIVGQSENSSDSEKVVEEVQDAATKADEGVLQEITDEEVKEVVENPQELVKETVAETKQEHNLPENIQKVVEFMNETGGTLQDYVRLNADYSNVDNVTLLREYYRKTKPYLEGEDINLLLEDFSYDEELDEERDVRKKCAQKENCIQRRSCESQKLFGKFKG